MATTAHDALRPLILLLHGLGATGAVWKSVEALLTERGDLRCLAPDLKGHGAASWAPRYSVGEMAADIATRLAGEAPVFIVGHSLGGYVALALAQGSSGVDVRGVVTIGTKLSWTPEELERAAEFARRPAKRFTTYAEALDRYRKISGLDPHLAPGETLLERGVVADGPGFRLAADPATVAVAVPSFAELLAGARCPVIAARGALDPLVTREELQRLVPGAHELPSLGHNVQVQSPQAVVALLAECRALADAGTKRV